MEMLLVADLSVCGSSTNTQSGRVVPFFSPRVPPVMPRATIIDPLDTDHSPSESNTLPKITRSPSHRQPVNSPYWVWFCRWAFCSSFRNGTIASGKSSANASLS